MIRIADEKEYPLLTAIWERAVRATHDFLPEENLQALKPLVRDSYLPAIAPYVWLNPAGEPQGFIGVAEGKIEMLFIDPDYCGQGVGTALIAFARQTLAANSVDVNEQNHRAVAFYLSRGFTLCGRSELDGEGNPFPLLHLRCQSADC
ncbi:GNAT family N-acetyltransferase [Mixta tenebrionis]|uniref:GNAT family N-acetyltransferase n=1 Tax=Mixta tenebrionis TaxID=2562439 RepID=A0A506V9T9_9GAMM|nr:MULTISPECIES: GNAT family N-acetyltransferase [Mixta]QHM74486.1 putative N-acetyltransferase YjaB [Mixta theicola]TPW42475.1 GNAT family N-acetyltransferase [Mixta tenebrionis]